MTDVGTSGNGQAENPKGILDSRRLPDESFDGALGFDHPGTDAQGSAPVSGNIEFYPSREN